MVSFDFVLMSRQQLDEIRKRFKSEGFNQGIKYSSSSKNAKWGLLSGIVSTKTPVATIYDYLSYFNNDNVGQDRYNDVTNIGNFARDVIRKWLSMSSKGSELLQIC